MTEIWLTKPYYEDFVARKGTLFSEAEAIDVYAQTQLLRKNWPVCIYQPPPEVGTKFKLFSRMVPPYEYDGRGSLGFVS